MIVQSSRRSFLVGSSLAGIAALGGCKTAITPESGNAANSGYTELLGVQLYTVRDKFQPDARGTLEALAEIGIKDCETAGLFEYKPADIRTMMDDLGLVSRSAHVNFAAMSTSIESALEVADALDQSNLYLSWIPEEERTPDGYRALADLLNQRGLEAKSAGRRIGYHNHEFEFDDLGGTTGYDILLERTDPDLVTMELDFFWVAEAGVDPLDLFAKSPGRFTSCHIKDRTGEGRMVAVGDGEIDFKTLLPLAQAAGIERFYIEHDNPENSLVSVKRSFDHLAG